MTPYDDILDLALISIEDYRLNKLAVYIEEVNYNLLIASTSYEEYVNQCNSDEYKLVPVKREKYDYIKNSNFTSYENYIDDAVEQLKIVLEGFMVRGLPNFNNCKKDLNNRSDTTRQFNIELNDAEKNILADWTVIMWFEKDITDTRQITGMLQDKNASKRYSEANLLKEKSERDMTMRENVNKRQTDYSFNNIPWNDWADGRYEL